MLGVPGEGPGDVPPTEGMRTMDMDKDMDEATLDGTPISRMPYHCVVMLMKIAKEAATDGCGVLAKVEAIRLLDEKGIVPLKDWDKG